MLATHKLRVNWCKKENTTEFHTPAGIQTKCDGHYMYKVISDAVLEELDERGYDVTTLKFSIEPKKGNKNFVSQRNNT